MKLFYKQHNKSVIVKKTYSICPSVEKGQKSFKHEHDSQARDLGVLALISALSFRFVWLCSAPPRRIWTSIHQSYHPTACHIRDPV